MVLATVYSGIALPSVWGSLAVVNQCIMYGYAHFINITCHFCWCINS